MSEFKVLSPYSNRRDMVLYDRFETMREVRSRLAEGLHALVVKDDTHVVYADTPHWPYLFSIEISSGVWIDTYRPSFVDPSGDIGTLATINIAAQDHFVQAIKGLCETEMGLRAKESVEGEYLDPEVIHDRLWRSGYLTTLGLSQQVWVQGYPMELEGWLNTVFQGVAVFSNHTVTIL